jgi:chitin disaccharide deacetylase
MIIINADDFGYDTAVNNAILNCFKKGYCSSTTIMANMPGFEEACQLVHEHKLTSSTGIHLVLTEGMPLTDGIKKCVRFCNSEGIFILGRNVRLWRLSAEEKISVSAELKAQIRKCRKYGINITHADSHKHAHEEWGLAQLVIDICLEEGIPYLRSARNCGSERTTAKQMYRYFLNRKINRAGLARTRYFGSANDVLFLLREKRISDAGDLVEVMLHPVYDSNGLLIDLIDGSELEKIIYRLRSN